MAILRRIILKRLRLIKPYSRSFTLRNNQIAKVRKRSGTRLVIRGTSRRRLKERKTRAPRIRLLLKYKAYRLKGYRPI